MMPETRVQATPKMLPYPRLEQPRLIRDGVTWLRVFHRRVETITAPFYGVNIWRVKRKKLAASMAHLINLAAPGLNNAYGRVHTVDVFEVDGVDDLMTVVLIYHWHSLPKVIKGTAPVEVLVPHFRFMKAVDSYNWNLVKTLAPNPATYAGMWRHRFHNDICVSDSF